MFSQPKVPVQVNVQVDNQYLDKHIKAYIEEYCKTFLRPQWLTIADMEKITRRKRAWIMDYLYMILMVNVISLQRKITVGNGYLMLKVFVHFLKDCFTIYLIIRQVAPVNAGNVTNTNGIKEVEHEREKANNAPTN